MQLILDGKVLDGPLSKDKIEASIRSLTGEGDSFAILSKDRMSYIQTSGSATTGFILEYQDGSIEEHYSCTASDLDEKQVIDAFRRYFDGDDRWRTDLSWAREDLGASSSGGGGRVVLVITVLIIVAVVWWYVFAA